ncbi:MAG: TolC family protein [Verrucomicrobia bacterium]|nr:TolC family protein [Verrucomicrobiota bacterium]
MAPLRKAIAARQVELAKIGYAQFQAALAARARSLAYDIFVAQPRANAAREVADRMQALQEVLVQRDPAGLNSVLETRILEASALTLQRRASQAEVAKRAALIELNQLRGLPLDATLRVASIEWQFQPVPANAELIAAARGYAFELRMRAAELAQQGFKVSLARNERHGNITVAPFYSEENAGDRERKVGVGVSVPLPLWSQNAGSVDTARARLEQAEVSVRVTQRQIERQVVTSAGEYAIKVAEIGHWRAEAAEQFRVAAAEADRHFRLGAVPIATYVELQKQYLDAIEALLETRREAFAAGQQVELLTGVKLHTAGMARSTPLAEPKP